MSFFGKNGLFTIQIGKNSLFHYSQISNKWDFDILDCMKFIEIKPFTL